MYSIDQKNEAVKNIQAKLLDIAYEKEEVLTLPVDGHFDSQTKEAVIRFQMEEGIAPTGEVDGVTFSLLSEKAAKITSNRYHSSIVHDDVFPLGVTSQGVYVEILQNLLNKMLQYLGKGKNAFHSGYFSDRTEMAVIAVQDFFGEEKTGRVSKPLMQKMQNFLFLMENGK